MSVFAGRGAYAPALTTAGQTMLTTHKKALILANAGIDVPVGADRKLGHFCS